MQPSNNTTSPAVPKEKAAGSSRAQAALRIVGMYREMPGLSLHPHQAARLFGLSSDTCQAVLEDLVATGQLFRRSDGQYAKA